MPPPHVGMITGSGAELQGTSGLLGGGCVCVCVHVCGCVCGGGGGGGTQLGHRGSEFPEAIVWDNSAEAPSWPGHANLGTNEI